MGAFFSGIFWSRFVGGGVLTLLVEVSNIFLTIRMMMKINNAQHLLLYQVNKYINLVMYFLFRLAPQAYLTHLVLGYAGQRTLGTFLLAILRKGLLDIPLMFLLLRPFPIYGIVWATPIADIACCGVSVALFTRFLRTLRRTACIPLRID